MGKSEKQMDKEQGRNQRIIDTAFQLFVEKKIEAVSMDEVAKEAGVGRATLFRCYNNKTELAIAVCASKWKAYLDKLDEARPISSIHDHGLCRELLCQQGIFRMFLRLVLCSHLHRTSRL